MEEYNKLLQNNVFTEDSIIMKTLRAPANPIYRGPARLYYPYRAFNTFIPILAIDDNNTIIDHSNSYFNDGNFVRNTYSYIYEYDKTHNIFNGLETVYNILINNKPEEFITEPVFLLYNPFSGRNAGHDTSILLDKIHYYRTNNLTLPIVLGETMNEFPFTMEICKLLLPDVKIYMIKPYTIYYFNNILITDNEVLHINKHIYLHKEIQDKLVAKCIDINKYKDKKICLMKNANTMKNIVSTWSAYYGPKTFDILEKKYGYIIINPEIMPYDEIILYLTFASKILVTFGSIMYSNGIFFNKTASLYYIYTLTHEPFYDKERYKWVNANNDLDSNIESFIASIDEDPQIYLSN